MAEYDLTTIGKEPIPGAKPAGEDIRYSDEFDWIEQEFSKLTKPVLSTTESESGKGGGERKIEYLPVDWDEIVDKGSMLMATQGKDLRVACYLLKALIETKKGEGVALGVTIFHDLVHNFWDSLYPVGRVREAAVERFGVLLSESLESLRDSSRFDASRDIEFLQKAEQQLTASKDFLQAKNIDYNAILKLQGCGRMIEEQVERMQSRPAEPPPPAAAAPASSPAGQPASAESRPASSAQPPAAKAATGDALAAVADLQQLSRALREPSKRFVEQTLETNPEDPLPYRWSRFVRWSVLNIAPSATVLGLNGPQEAQVTAVKGYFEQGDWPQLFKSSEKIFLQFPEWLDLQRYSLESISRLGDSYAAVSDAIRHELTFLLRRLPHLSILKYQNGIELADNETKEWLRTLAASSGPEPSQSAVVQRGGSHESSESTSENGIQFNSRTSLSENMSRVTAMLQEAGDSHTSYMIKLRFAEYLMKEKQALLAYGYLDNLYGLLEYHKLEQWSPSIASDTLSLMYLCGKQVAKTWKEQTQPILDRCQDALMRISVLDPARALKLVNTK